MAKAFDLGQEYFTDITIVQHSLKQFIAIKRTRFGIESYVLTNTDKWYTGSDTYIDPESDFICCTTNFVMRLLLIRTVSIKNLRQFQDEAFLNSM